MSVSWSIVLDVVIGLTIFTSVRAVLVELFGPSLRALQLFLTEWLLRRSR
jgi:hypothetical protein